MKHSLLSSSLLALSLVVSAQAAPLEELLARYQSAGASSFDATRGAQLWQQTVTPAGETQARSCSTCHTDDLRAAGKHARTGKAIDALAPAANPKRLTDIDTMEKWLTRNCKWTWGRVCTPQEKGDLLSFIKSR